MRPRIFVTQPIAESALKRLQAVADVKVNPVSNRVIPKKALVTAVRKHDFLFSLLHDVVDRSVIAANPKLRAVTSMSITPDNIDVGAATARRIPVTVVPPIVAEATADINFGLTLMVARRMVEGDRLVRKGIFPGAQSNHLAGAAVYGKTIGLVGGGGRIGGAVARRAHGFGMRVLGNQRRLNCLPPEAEPARLDDLLAASDFVVVACPLTPETHHLFDRQRLGSMKRTAWLINVGRGAVVQEEALVEALRGRSIGGAMLDVFEHYRLPPGHPLLALDNAVLTPHLAGMTVESRGRISVAAAEEMLRMLDGEPPSNFVNPEALARIYLKP